MRVGRRLGWFACGFALFACSSKASNGMGNDGTSGSFASAGRTSAATVDKAENAGSGGLSQVSSNGSGGTRASSGGSGGAAVSAAGRTAAIGGKGGSGAGGSSATGGSVSDAGSSGRNSGGSSGDRGSSGTTGALCKPIGWATRSGRTGGAVDVTGGGSGTPLVVKSFAELQMYATDDQARVIYVDGTLGSGWSGTSGDRLEIKSNKTIVGMRPGTELKAPIHIKDASNVIVRNIVIHGPGSNTDQAWDNLNIEGSSKNIWIDHCEFWDGQDGNADVVKGADTVTFTWNIFGYKQANEHNFSNLVASSDDEPASEGKLNITLMFNHFRGIAQRGPRCRYGYIHVVNNLYTKDGLQSDYAVSAGKDCKVITESNHFIDTSSPIYTSHQAGSSANDVRDNLFDGTSGNTTGYGTSFTPPYDYASVMVPANQVKALVEAKAGATLASPTDCD